MHRFNPNYGNYQYPKQTHPNNYRNQTQKSLVPTPLAPYYQEPRSYNYDHQPPKASERTEHLEPRGAVSSSRDAYYIPQQRPDVSNYDSKLAGQIKHSVSSFKQRSTVAYEDPRQYPGLQDPKQLANRRPTATAGEDPKPDPYILFKNRISSILGMEKATPRLTHRQKIARKQFIARNHGIEKNAWLNAYNSAKKRHSEGKVPSHLLRTAHALGYSRSKFLDVYNHFTHKAIYQIIKQKERVVEAELEKLRRTRGQSYSRLNGQPGLRFDFYFRSFLSDFNDNLGCFFLGK